MVERNARSVAYFHLHQAPVVGLPERVRHRAALRGIAIQRAVQLVGREGIRQFLRAGPSGHRSGRRALSAMV